MDLKKLLDKVNQTAARKDDIGKQIVVLLDAEKYDEAYALEPELEKAKAEHQQAFNLYVSMQDALKGSDPAQRFVPAGGEREPEEIKDLRASPEYQAAFISALRNGVTPKAGPSGKMQADQYQLLINALTETGGSPAGEEGGFLLPVDFDNMIHERMRQFIDLADPRYFNVEDVQAYSGWRAVEAATAEEPFDALVEMDVLADNEETESPLFSKVEYTIVDYGGFLRVSNSLLADTPVNIMRYISRWFGKKVVLTNNSLILALVDAISASETTPDTLFADLKTVLNVTLDPAISARAVLFTNQNGLNFLDQALDNDNRALLQPDPVEKTRLRVLGRELVVLSNAHWADLGGGAPLAVGDGTEFLTFFRRQPFEMASTNIGGSAWRSNTSEVRGIMRADAAGMDSEAMALLTIAEPSS